MTGALLRPENRWQRVFTRDRWSLWHTSGPNKHGWSRFCLRLDDGQARRRSWWMVWNDPDERLGEDDNMIGDLQRRYPEIYKLVVARLKVWTPQG